MKIILSAAALALTALAGAAPAQAGTVKAGMLTCHVDGASGYVLGSNKTVNCSYKPKGQPTEYYTGVISRYGVDVGFTEDTVIKWAVLEKHFSGYEPGGLAGNYVGVGSEATVAYGLGSNVLVSKYLDKWVLQTLSIQGQKGFNAAVGLAELDLVPATK